MLTPGQLSTLRTVALNSNSGPWHAGVSSVKCGSGFVVAKHCLHEDATHIAAFHPKEALALLDHIDAQAARIAELERDAARYRWLRSDDIEVLPGQREICAVRFPLPSDEDGGEEVLFESELDAAIDAAIEQDHAEAQGTAD